MKTTALAFILCGHLCFSAGAQAQRALDAARMQRDLEIMEMVLQRLLNENTTPIIRLGSDAARGVYLPEFGVLFQVPQTPLHFSYFEFHAEGEGRGDMALDAAAFEKFGRHATAGERGGIRSAPEAKTFNEEFTAELMDFFSRYADAIGQLREQDRIAVYRTGGPEFSFFFNFPGAQERRFRSSNREVLAWVYKSDLNALQTGKLSDDDFKKRVRFAGEREENTAGRGEARELELLAGNLDVALGAPRGTANGIYLDDYGAVLFAWADFNHPLPRQARNWRTEFQKISNEETAPRALEDYLRATERAHSERLKNWQSEREKFKEKMFAAIADYGHTLRSLAAADRLVVVADLPNAPVKQPRQLVCAVKKDRVDQYDSGKISREQLRQATTFYEN